MARRKTEENLMDLAASLVMEVVSLLEAISEVLVEESEYSHHEDRSTS